ncbi:hypothetical protein NIES3806_19720 [Microcystis aeruginosa NIES-3806]|nr:hypothetical protein NIES3806_19720 [Microcystis aeruginosa NIES-3806]
MGAICLIDTSIFLEILNVPHKASQSELIFQELKEKIEAGESLFLPMATILETGNHIAQNGDGNQRRICAEKFVNQVTQALEGESPFTPINFLKQEDLQGWLKEFPDEAMQRRGLGTFLSFMIGRKFVIKIQAAASIYGLWTNTLKVTSSHRSYE